MSEVVFRRVRGRIIPIKVNGEKRDRSKQLLSRSEKGMLAGAGIAAVGVVSTFESGYQYKNLFEKSLGLHFAGRQKVGKKSFNVISKARIDKASDFLPEAGKSFKTAASKAKYFSGISDLNRSRYVAKFAKILRKGGPLVGAGLVAYGASKFVANMNKDKRNRVSPEAAGLLGLSAGSGAYFLSKHADDVFAMGVKGRAHALKSLGWRLAKKSLSLGENIVKAL